MEVLHPEGLCCPDCGAHDQQGVHRCHRDPVLDFQCGHCGRVYNAWTGTPLAGTHHKPSVLLLVLRGILQGVSTAQLARELKLDRYSASPKEWARDDDGDGVREVHINTAEGTWLGLRNFLRIFRGVSKHFLNQYVAIFQLKHNFKAVSTTVLRILLGVQTPSTDLAS